MSLVMVIMIAVSLSMDAFSLSLAYGTLNLEKKMIQLLSFIVGTYHFFMPLLGMWIGNKILSFLPIGPNIVVFLVLLVIGIEMIIESFKQTRAVHFMKFSELLLFGLAVSLDSFSVGLGLRAIYSKPIICSIIFSVASFLFTYLGLYLGKKINDMVGRISTRIGGIALICIGIFYLI